MQGLIPATVNSEQSSLSSGRLERRRAVSHDARAPSGLVGDAPRPEIAHRLLADYARNRLAVSGAMAAAVLLAAWIASGWLPSASITVWTMVALCTQALLGVLCLCFRSPIRIDERHWTALFVGAEFLCGLAWTWLLILLASEPGPDPAVFQFATLLVVAASATFAAALPPATIAATAPIALALVVLLVQRHEPLYLGLAHLAIAVEIFFLCLSLRIRRSIRDLLLARAEQAQLSAELTDTQADSDQSLQTADKAQLAQSRFLAAMNHELRTPLNAILGFSEVMKNEVLGPLQNRAYRDYAGDIHASGRHLLSLIDDLLDLSRLEGGRYRLHEQPVALETLLRDSERSLADQLRNSGTRLVVEFEPHMPLLQADPAALRRALDNLLANAIQHTPVGGDISLLAGWTAGGGQYVSVRDTGPGIAAKDLQRVLAPFERGEDAIRLARPGLGTGLPMVEALIRLHGGRLDLRTAPGEGTVATLSLPRWRVLENAGSDVPASENVIPWRSAG